MFEIVYYLLSKPEYNRLWRCSNGIICVIWD